MAVALSVEATKNPTIDFSSVESLPEPFKWFSNGSSDDLVDKGVSIPVVDLQDPNAIETIKHACEEWGVFLLKNHGIPLSLFNEVDNQIKRFFSLPMEQKAKALGPGDSGYDCAYIGQFVPKLVWHEGFIINGSSYENAEKVLPPHDVPLFCKTIAEIKKQLKMVAEKVAGEILKLLGAHDAENIWMVESDNMTIRMNSFPICPEPDRAMGQGPHKDTSMITLIHELWKEDKTQSNVPTKDKTKGLQIFKEGIGWVPVNPDPDMIVVNVGDILEILSNGRFKSLLHRVTVSGLSHRYSLGLFTRPSLDTLLCPIESPPRFRAVTLRELNVVKAKDPLNVASSLSI